MCGIVGLYFKKKKLHSQLGKYLSGMLDNMSSRGPDSAGFAVYNNVSKKYYKYSLCIADSFLANKFELEAKKKFNDVKIKNLSDQGITILMVEHNIEAVMKISERVVVLAEGQVIAEGSPQDVRNNNKVIEAYLGTVDE